jgi:2',3'-cyclic-nucleotide 2'-phosphodiesterase (5'-nucleotidase family)
LSNFVSDLILGYAQDFVSKNKQGIQVNFSLMNHGGLRTSLPMGKITTGDIFELMPFENELVLLKLTGSQVSELAHYIASRDGEGVSGISFGIKSGRAVWVEIQSKPLEIDSTYWMVTNDYIANGGDGMKVLTSASQRIITGTKIRDVIINHLKDMKLKGQTVTAKTDGRIYHVE